jgi:hypothetical protein
MSSGRMLIGEQELIWCGQCGGVDRNSDPAIGALINSLTHRKADVTLANPVGLYFDDLPACVARRLRRSRMSD